MIWSSLACSRLPDSGEDAKEKGIFVFALSQFSGPDYLGAWNRLDHHRPADWSAEIFLELKNPNRHIKSLEAKL